MKIIIETIPHVAQRYPTCGDWWVDPDGTIQIRVSEEMDSPSTGAVAIHELIEFYLLSNGFSATVEDLQNITATVDSFDKDFEAKKLPGEPGDHPFAPYRHEHSIATAVERILLADLGFSWANHEAEVEELFQ
jgi:hypothetical protein